MRGNSLVTFLNQFELVVLNEGSMPTFTGIGRGYIIDVAAVSESIVGSAADWVVRDDVDSMSDLEYIVFTVGRLQQTPPAEAPKGWDVSKGIEADSYSSQNGVFKS